MTRAKKQVPRAKLDKKKKFILWFSEVNNKDVALVGGKNASLGEMYSQLVKKGVLIPNGYAVTAYAYFYLLKKAKIAQQIKDILKDLNTHNLKNLMSRGRAVRQTILKAPLPLELEEEIIKAYRQLEKQYGKNVDVAVRSSATAEDLPDASFAGQQETYLNIRGTQNLLMACRKCFASLFTNRAISYREDKGFDHFKIGLSIAIQKMVRSDKAGSGVMFSIDTETGFANSVLINAAYGLGENIVQGAVNPDEYYVFKPTLDKYKPIISKRIGSKRIKMIYSDNSKEPTVNVPVSKQMQAQFMLTDQEVLKLAKWAVIIEDHYQKPMDMEWAKDGQTGKMYIVQARPETVQSQRNYNILEEYSVLSKGKILAKGAPVGAKVAFGVANVIKNVRDIHKFKKGQILVTEMTDPDWEPIMKIAAGIVTDKGGRTCHAAIVSRELGIPCIVGTENASRQIKPGQTVTVSCAEGENGFIYEGKAKVNIKTTNLKGIKKTKTKIMMNLGSPDIAFDSSFIPNDGVGLAREEFIINSYIQIHPMALIHFNKVKSAKERKEIMQLTKGYKDKKKYFIDKLAQGIAMIGAAFYPKDVIVRLSDFKTNEYANLIGGKYFEPEENNPMIGWRGASRYYDENFKAGFALECKALRKVREEMGLTNVKIMVPFCRTVEEGKLVIAEMKKHGLVRGKDGLELYVMCEIPSNVILADQFAKIFDGFSIGTNDLTQLTLGVDRDSALVAHVYDERNKAVKDLVKQVIDTAHKYNRKIGLCGQAPSDYPEFAKFLVECGIDSISLNPDTVIKTTLMISKMKKKKK
ncbi:phosphoenolpyruvate synthase [Patescibacteria group bacterium]|nr:phosphoenolpyruvate synthase [Patescibacteria group bacterium]